MSANPMLRASDEHLASARYRIPLCHPSTRSAHAEQIDTRNTVMMLALSIATCTALFLIAYGGWGL